MEKEQIRQVLAQEAARLAGLREDIRERGDLDNSLQTESGGEISSTAQHPADVATEVEDREIDLTLLERIDAELVDVEHALQKLNEGKYGTCDRCGVAINEERLEELPATRVCYEHAQAFVG